MITILAALILAAPAPPKGGPPMFAGLNTPPPQNAAFAVRVLLGIKDTEPREWSGSMKCNSASVLKCEGWRFAAGDRIEQPAKWTARTALGPVAPTRVNRATEGPQPESKRAPLPVGVVIYFDKAPTSPIAVTTAQGDFTVAPAELDFGKRIVVLEGNAAIERVAVPLTPPTTGGHEDYPSVLPCVGGSLRLTAIAYTNESDRVVCWTQDGGKWSATRELSPAKGDCFGTAQAGGWIVWSEQRGQEWDLIGRQVVGEKVGEPVSLTTAKGPDIFHAMAAGPNDNVWLAWQGFRDGKSQIVLKHFDGKKWGSDIQLSEGAVNNWQPAIAVDSKGRVLVAWDSYEAGNYDIRARFVTDGKAGLVLKVTRSPLFEAHASVAFDRQDRAWIAWDESGANWGKDTGFLIPKQIATRLYQGRMIRVASLEPDGELLAPAADIHAVLPESPLFKGQVQTEVCEMPRLTVDGSGRLWCFLRHRLCRTPREDGWAANGVWEILATCYDGKAWSAPVYLPHSNNRNDAALSLALSPDGALWAAWQTDNRTWGQPAPRKGDVRVATLGGASKTSVAALATRSWTAAASAKKATHPSEPTDVSRIRGFTATIGGKTCHIYRGDLHRHTEQSIDGPGDGSLWDLYRYALDAAAFDFILVADHNDGNDHEYQWWRREKSNDLFLLPGAFTPLYGYERSVAYPNGHRNVFFARRGVKTLPIEKEENRGEKNTGPLIYPYLRQFNGICTSHTSATDQGTDWRDNNPQLEPVVEIYQGYHTSYEHESAPKTVNDKTDRVHGQYQPAGFVWRALEKGYRMGFQASSDHISTHISYACVFTDDFSRQGLIDGFKCRHCYAATDNIIMDVRMGDHFMGDEFDVQGAPPALQVKIIGTGAIKQVDVVKNNAYVFTRKPKAGQATVEFNFSDAKAGDTPSAYYYVRVEQTDGQMAWASPIWVNRK